MPQASTRMRTWPGPGSGMGRSTTLRIFGAETSTALYVLFIWNAPVACLAIMPGLVAFMLLVNPVASACFDVKRDRSVSFILCRTCGEETERSLMRFRVVFAATLLAVNFRLGA